MQVRARNLAIAFDNDTWASMSFENFARMSEPERVPKQDGVAGVVFEAPFKIMKVCAFFRDPLFSDATWQVFGKYTPAAEGEQYGTPPIADVLELGVRVNVQGFVIPAQLGRRGAETALVLRAGSHYHFLGALSAPARSGNLRWAMLECTDTVGALYLAPFQAQAVTRDSSMEAIYRIPYTAARAKAMGMLHLLSRVSPSTLTGVMPSCAEKCVVCLFARTNCSLPIAQVGGPSHSAVRRLRRQHRRKPHLHPLQKSSAASRVHAHAHRQRHQQQRTQQTQQTNRRKLMCFPLGPAPT